MSPDAATRGGRSRSFHDDDASRHARRPSAASPTTRWVAPVVTGIGVISLTLPGALGETAAVLLLAAVATWLTRVVLTWMIRRIAAKQLAETPTIGRWRTRMARPSEKDVSVSEIRRHHRIDAAAFALSRLGTMLIWSVTAVVILHVHGISVSVAVSSAGFIGLIFALGAQNTVNDYITGLHVLLEDRFGEGDDIEVVTEAGRHLRGVVTAHGMFGTRLQAGGVTHHLANRFMCEVTNHSQMGVVTTFDIDHPVDAAAVAAAAARASASRPEMPAVVIDRLEEQRDSEGTGQARSRVHLRAARPLGETDQHHLTRELSALLEAGTPPAGPAVPRPQ